jgi:hypothetical protein
MTPKELLKLANACKKAGIRHFRQGDIEFTFGEEEQPIVVNSNKAQVQGAVTTDSLSETDLLFWSTVPDSTAENPTQ